MEHIAQKLRKAYDLIAHADTTEISAYMLAVDEAQGYIAEALDLVEALPPQFFEDKEGCKFYIDSEQVSCQEFNDYFNTHDVGWEEDWEEQHDGTYTIYKIYRDDARS